MELDRPVELVLRGLAQPDRLDRVLRRNFPRWGRRAVAALINGRQVLVNGQVVWLASWQVRDGDRVEILAPPADKPLPPVAFDDAWIVVQDDELIAVNKPAGLLAHSVRPGRPSGLLELARPRFGEVTLFHRLDRDTSGVVLLARPGPVNRYLDAAFKAGTVTKEYLALVPAGGRLAAEGTIELRIGRHPRRRDMMAVAERGGRRAVTRYRVLGQAEGVQLVTLWPQTGRTHQLRVHLAALGAPILGDRLYGRQGEAAGRLMLHARRIALPESNETPGRAFAAPLPDDLTAELPRPLLTLIL